VPPEDGRLTPKTCRGLRHNKVFVKVKVKVCYTAVVHRYMINKILKINLFLSVDQLCLPWIVQAIFYCV
jgi:hypothetical protein